MTDCCLPGTETDTYAQDNLKGCGCVKTQPFTVAAGTYVRGEVLEDNAGVLQALAADGTTAFAIMPFDVTLAADDEVAVYVGGEFNEDALTLANGTVAEAKEPLSIRGIQIRKFSAA